LQIQVEPREPLRGARLDDHRRVDLVAARVVAEAEVVVADVEPAVAEQREVRIADPGRTGRARRLRERRDTGVGPDDRPAGRLELRDVRVVRRGAGPGRRLRGGHADGETYGGASQRNRPAHAGTQHRDSFPWLARRCGPATYAAGAAEEVPAGIQVTSA